MTVAAMWYKSSIAKYVYFLYVSTKLKTIYLANYCQYLCKNQQNLSFNINSQKEKKSKKKNFIVCIFSMEQVWQFCEYQRGRLCQRELYYFFLHISHKNTDIPKDS